MKKIINIVKHPVDLGNGIKLNYLQEIELYNADITEGMLSKISALSSMNYIKVFTMSENYEEPMQTAYEEVYVEEPMQEVVEVVQSETEPEVILEPIETTEEVPQQIEEEPVKKQRGRPKKVEEVVVTEETKIETVEEEKSGDE